MKSDEDFIDALDKYQEKIRDLKYETMTIFTEPLTSKDLIRSIYNTYKMTKKRKNDQFPIAGIELFGNIMTTVFNKKLSGQPAYSQLMYYDFEQDHESAFSFTSDTSEDRIENINRDQTGRIPPKQWVSQHLAEPQKLSAESLIALADGLPSKEDYNNDSDKLGTKFSNNLVLSLNKALKPSQQITHWSTHASCMVLFLALGYYLFTNIESMSETIFDSRKKVYKYTERIYGLKSDAHDNTVLYPGSLAEKKLQLSHSKTQSSRYQTQHKNMSALLSLNIFTIMCCTGAFIYSFTSLLNSLKAPPSSWQQVLAKAYLPKSGLALD